jgi:hypothetical protein
MSEVAVALAPGDLIERDLKQVAEPVGRQQLIADPLDDPPDRLPIDPHQPRNRGLIGLWSPATPRDHQNPW